MTLRVLLLVAGWCLGWWLLWRVPRVRPASGEGAAGLPVGFDPSRVTVVIPARDEAASLPHLLASLAEQTVRPGRIVVIDDGSTDGTGALARAVPGVTVIDGRPLPAGWTGKTWALHQGVAAAGGEVLVFLDADVRLAPDALAGLLAEHARRGGLVSVQPYHHTERAYEQLAALFNIVSVMGVGMASPGRDGRAHAAFGPCLVTSRADYARVGGHDAVRGEIVEDVAIAREYAAAGLPVTTLGGGSLVSFRMYPGGLGQLVEGFSKNMATGAGSVPLLRALATVAWVAAVVVSVQVGIEWAFGLPGAAPGAVVAVVLAAFAVQVGAMLRQLGDFTWLTALAYPAPLGIFVVVFVRSTWWTLVRRRVEWRGRAIPLARERRWAGDSVGAGS